MKVVVLGATGHLGAYTAQRLLDEGHAVTAVGRRVSDNAFFASLVPPRTASAFAPAQTEGLAA